MTNHFSLQMVQKLVSQGEGQTLEFKRKANFPEKIIKEMVAFANTDGGYLLVGVDDNGTIPGLKHVEEEKYILERTLGTHCKPKLRYKIHTLPVSNNRSLLIFKIYKSARRPHYALDHPDQKWGKAFIRLGDKSLQASRETVEILKGVRSKGGQKIYYGEKEEILFKHLEKEGKITLSEFSDIARLPRKQASRTLVKLVLSNVLRIVHQEREEYFVFNNHIPQ